MRQLLVHPRSTIIVLLLLIYGCVTQSPAPLTAVVFSHSSNAAARSVERAGGHVTHDLHLINAVGASISENQLDSLSKDATLSRLVIAENDSLINDQSAATAPQITRWLKKSVTRPAVNNTLHNYLERVAPTLTGRGIGIALIDTGLSPGAATKIDSPLARRSFNALTNTVGEIEDQSGHGTHLASLISGFGSNFRGIAPNADIIAIKAFNREDIANTLDIIRAIQWVVDHRAEYNIRVLNLSISASADLPYYLDPMNIALTNAWNEGLIIVVSAGNEGPSKSSVTAPGNNPWLITVGAADFKDNEGWTHIAPFSGRGPTNTGHIKPDIIVPGTLLAGVQAVGAKRPAAEPDHRDPDGFWITSGASQASAIAAGLIALILEARPHLSNYDVKCILANTASPLLSETAEPISPFTQGRGLLDLGAALESTDTHCAERLEGIDPTKPLEGAFPSD